MPNRLKELRRSAGITQKELASSLGIAQPTLSGWETDRFQIDYDNLVKLADFFGTSIDYILGRSVDEQTTVCNSSPKKEPYNNKPAVRSDEEKLLGVYNSLDKQSKNQLMSVAYLIMSQSLKAQGIDVQEMIERQLHKIQNEGGEKNDG
ncbi:helix-turn-helix domain-containing protein [Phascolarctobacterium succinatutens]|uniref:HTH cro/C1-type domain-containing protein n=1 Tax=Phascolarctobacterium succinatutens TaxID=626940 RepID=A0A1Q6R550_9FIRM|nr:helix-turn-helix transcriptional regulator [Phascolarctobacterium succinatutens]OLA37477.1 MAG: hypothetical protein BHW43_06525 [Phascolarctobacterium succinatutens]